MLRGRQTITAIFSDETPKLKIVRGGYTFERDVLLAYRFFYWHKLKNRDFEVILGFLEMEFFISQRTIADKLADHQLLLKDIKGNNPNAKTLAKRYPHFNWK